MLFMNNMKHYNIPQKKFITDNVYTSFSKIGNYLISGYLGPDGSTAIDFSKRGSMKKAFSEILERRALSAGGITNKKGEVYAVNLIKRKPTFIDMKYSTYSNEQDYPIDTTGSASHTNSKIAIYNSLKELMEKNALFLFWYGLKGKRLVIKEKNFFKEQRIIKSLHDNNKETFFYINDFFYPLRVVISFILKDTYICSTGVGSSFCIKQALNKSIEEAFLLLWKDETIELVESKGSTFEKKYEDHTACLKHLDHIKETLVITHFDEVGSLDKKNPDYLLKLLPEWIEDVYMIPLNQVIRHGMKSIKIFSPHMYNHIPMKEYINVSNPMNTCTIHLSGAELQQIPDCIVI